MALYMVLETFLNPISILLCVDILHFLKTHSPCVTPRDKGSRVLTLVAELGWDQTNSEIHFLF